MSTATGSTIETHIQTVWVGKQSFQIQSLKNQQQFADPQGRAAQAGISDSTWPLFGRLWPSGRVLADLMQVHAVQGRRVLELGCGLGLASLVLHARGADITASDYHPVAGDFLGDNIILNQMLSLDFVQCDWQKMQPNLGCFDLIIGSDLLYEPNHPALLSGFIDRHSQAGVEVLIVDPNRRQQRAFGRDMQALGYSQQMTRSTDAQWLAHQFKGKVMTYLRP